MIKSVLDRFVLTLDDLLGSHVCEGISRVKAKMRNSNFPNTIRRNVELLIVKFRQKLGMKGKITLKLHLGCVNRHFEHYTNIN